ncbi:MAG: TolC family protein [Planctomycetaceae bacterium]|nr:TolC family protein [Planctomycetaceae bacterium]
MAAIGCAGRQPAIRYIGDGDNRYYRAQATEIDYPLVADNPPEALTASSPPRTIRDLERAEIRDLTLAEAQRIALENSEIIRRYGDFLSPGNSLFQNPNFVPSVYDPAIQESGVLFGGRGVEAALADFDASLTSAMVWGRDERIRNVAGAPTSVNETATYTSSLQKIFANGGVVSVNQDVNYLWSNTPGDLFDSTYTGSVGMTYQQPLLAGSGTQFTRTAGPIARSFGGITGVSQGVLISRINNDISLADFEESVHGLAFDVETAYWDLYLAYRNFDTATVLRNAAMDTWRLTSRQAGEVLIAADEAQARSALYNAEAATETAQSNLYQAETQLRRLLAMPVNDGTVLRPVDEPVSAELIPDWYASLTEALGRRVDLRRQKWNIKSLELQLDAADSLTQPRLDFIGGYQVNAFGDDLLDYSGPAINSYGQTLAANNQTGWNLGLQMNWPIGLRSAHAQVRNYELRLAKAQQVLAAQELEVGHELAASFQELARAHATMRSTYQAYVAAEENVRGLLPRVLTEDTVDVILRAYQRRAESELAFYRNVVDYNKSIAALQLRKGTILDYNSIAITEGPWNPDAYYEAGRHADARAHAFKAKFVETEPSEFAADAPAGRSVMYTSEAAARRGTTAQPATQQPYYPQPDPQPAPPVEADPPPPPSQDGASRESASDGVTRAGWDQPGSARLGVRPDAATPRGNPAADSETGESASRLRLNGTSGLFDF